MLNWVLPNILRQCNDIETNPGPGQTKPPVHFEIGHINMRSIKALAPDPNNTKAATTLTKMDLLRNHMTFHHYSILGISETWLDSTFDENKLIVNGYQTPFRRDGTAHSCGSMIYIGNDIPACRRKQYEPTGSEILCVELSLKKTKVLISSCYRPQHRDITDFCGDIQSILDAAATKYQSLIFIGDMNARNTHFWDGDITNTEGRAIKAYFDSQNFEQLIHEPTRIQGNSKSCIDLVFTNSPSLISTVETRPKIYDTCDHKPVVISLKSTFQRPQSYKRWVWNYKRGDFDKFQQGLLNAPWHMCYNNDSLDDTVTSWSQLFINTAERTIPHYCATIRPRDKEFMNGHIRRTMRERDRIHKQIKAHPADENLKQQFKVLRNKVVTLSRKSKCAQEEKDNAELSSVQTSSKKWWKLSNSITNSNHQICIGNTPIMNGSDIITGNHDKANLLNKYFVTQSTLDESNARLPPNPPNPHILIEQKVIQPEDVYEILINLDVSKATGPDGISNRLLREAAVSISQPLSHLFNYSLSKGQFPESWKLAHVIPVYKKDDPKLCNNYRPISLLCCISKVFEKILFNHIYTFLKDNGLLNSKQSGFTPGDGTINQLIKICNDIHSQLDNDNEILAVFLDLTKAFDKVWHKGLLYKLKGIGINGLLFKWIESYLTKRKQRVVINGSNSEILELNAGVPQGSVLGPLLFLIYINDISDGISGETYLFADDSSIFHIVNNDIYGSVNKMNKDLCSVNDWAGQWLVSINVPKTVSMFFSTKRKHIKLPPIKLGGTTLLQVFSHKHLGLILAPNLSWNEHISSIIAKANKRLFFMKALKYKISRLALSICYTSFIRPIMEYGDVLFDSCTKELSNAIEAVQLEAARTVSGAKKRSSHEALYMELGWLSLHERRQIHRLTKIYMIHNNLAPKYLTDVIKSYQKPQVYGTRLAQNRNHLGIPKPNKLPYSKSFFIASIKAWNELNPIYTNAPSLQSFKHRLKKSKEILAPYISHEIPRHSQIVIAQLRIGFSDLNAHLHYRGCIESPTCQCGHRREDTRHFIWACPAYEQIRQSMLNIIRDMNLSIPVNFKLLLYGNKNLPVNKNLEIQKHFSAFLIQSKRFLNYQ